jgi:D-sedoheptulose 7-phosphate isomerase
MTTHTTTYLQETAELALALDAVQIERLTDAIVRVREQRGRLFLLGVGGSAANCSHAVNDFRKLCSVEAYAPTDNVAELTARVNDEGWDGAFAAWLQASKLNPNDAILVLSVGGGDESRGISVNLIRAIEFARSTGSAVLAILGRPDGFAALHADVAVVLPASAPTRLTPHAEAFQAVIWHCLVSDPRLQTSSTTW